MIIRQIQTTDELHGVWKLTHDVYVRNGYCKPRATGWLIHYPRLDSIIETTVFIAIEGGKIVGTNSITLDGPCGLHVDNDFPKEVNKIRQERRKLCASWRIVTDCKGIMTVVRLIKKTISYALNELQVETALFTFNPDHESFYKRYLNMTTIARCDCIGKLKNAPAVLMRADKETINERRSK